MPGPSSATLDHADDVRGPHGRVIVDAVVPGRAAHERLRELIAELKSESVLAPVTVVVGSTLTGIGLRRTLARSGRGLAGVRFQTLDELAELHAPVDGAPLTTAVRNELVRLTLDEDPEGPLGQVRSAPATQAAVAQAFGRLREATAVGDSVLDELAGQGGLVGDLVAAFRRFRGRAGAYVDGHDRAIALADALAAGDVDLQPVGPVVLYLPGRLVPAQQRLIERLAERTATRVLAPVTADEAVDQLIADRCRRSFGAGPDGRAAERRLPDLIVEAPDATEEARAAARRVIELLERGVPADEIAVLHRRDDAYAAALRESFRRAGVPFHGPDGRTLLTTAVGTTLVDLLRWHDHDHDRTGFLDWLHAAPVVVGGQPAPVRHWSVLSAEANVTRHRRHWDRRLDALARRASAEAAAGTERSDRFRELAHEAAAFRGYVLDLIDRLVGPPEETWGGWSAWAIDLLDHTLGELDGDDELRARELIAELARLDDLADEGTRGIVDRRAFTQAVTGRLRATVSSVGELGRGVLVGPLRDAVHLGHAHVVIVGAVEGSFPVPPADDPLLPDRAIEGLPSHDGLATGEDRRADDAIDLALVVAAAEDLTVTWSRADRRQQRGQVPAPWLLAVAGARLGLDRPLRVDELEGLTEPWYRVLASSQDALDQERPLDLVERRLATVVAEPGDPATHPALHVRPEIAAGLNIERTRAGEDLSAFDAHVGPHPALEELLGRAQSPTALEAYGACPRSFLFRRVLGVGSIEDTREPLTMSGRDRGSIIHEVLDRYAQALGDEPASLERRRHTMSEIAGEVLSDAESRWPVGRALLWQHEQLEIRSQLDMVVTVEDVLRRRFATTVTEPEVSVGDGPDDPDATEVELPSGRTLRFKGRIDRLDRDADGTQTVVASDYKTGNTSGFGRLAVDPVINGTKLQAAIYALMAQHRHPEADVHAQYWAVNGRAHPGNATAGSFSLTEQREAILEALDLVTQGIADGVFPATPGEWNDFRGTYDACSYCPYDRICAAPGERERAWERDRRAPATAPVLALHEARYLPIVSTGDDA